MTSRIGKLPIDVPAGVDINITGADIKVKASKGELGWTIPEGVEAKLDGAILTVNAKEESASALHGLSRSLIQNMIIGVTEGYKKDLEIVGTGYRATLKGNSLEFALGFSHGVTVDAPEGITFAVNDGVVSVSGIDKQLVGETAANIRKLKPPEPYKGKGIKYSDEVIRRKAGKAGK
jgi:large subunit ribosomal protein L6